MANDVEEEKEILSNFIAFILIPGLGLVSIGALIYYAVNNV